MVTGHIRLRTAKDGKKSYQVIVETERDPLTGKRQRKYATVKGTKKEAEAMLEKIKTELSSYGVFKPSAIKLKDWMDEWLTLYLPNIEATTRAGYEERIKNRIFPYLGNIPLNCLTTKEIQQWVNKLSEEGLSPKTVKNVFLNIKSALDKAVVLKMITANPCEGVELPKMEKYQAEVYDTEEISKLLEVAKGTDMYLLAILEIFTGLRRGELVALEWSDIDLESGTVNITRNVVLAGGKKVLKAPKSTSGTRSICVGDEVKAILKQEYLNYCKDKLAQGQDFVDSGRVIRQSNGAAYSPDSITQKWIRFRKKHNLKEIRLHDLRHTSATAMLSVGVSMKVIQQRMGHSDISTTMNIYAHALPSMNKDAGEKLDKLIPVNL